MCRPLAGIAVVKPAELVQYRDRRHSPRSNETDTVTGARNGFVLRDLRHTRARNKRTY